MSFNRRYIYPTSRKTVHSKRNEYKNETHTEDTELDNINNNVINSIIRLRSTLDYISLNRITNNNRTFMIQLLEAYSIYDDYDNLDDVKVTMNKDEFSKLKTFENNQEQSCSICLDSLKNKKVTELKCQHIFHNECIHPWLTKQSVKCPICRMPQKGEEIHC